MLRRRSPSRSGISSPLWIKLIDGAAVLEVSCSGGARCSFVFVPSPAWRHPSSLPRCLGRNRSPSEILVSLANLQVETRPSSAETTHAPLRGLTPFRVQSVALQKECHKQGEKRLGYAGLCRSRRGATLRRRHGWPMRPCTLCNKRSRISSRLMPTSLPSGVGFRASRRKAYPKASAIPTRNRSSSIRPTVAFFYKLGWLRYRNSRKVLGEVKQVTVCQSVRSGSYRSDRALRRAAPATGRGCRHRPGDYSLCYALRGTFYAPLNSFKRHETALRKAQQAMSRKTTSSNNWKKAKGRVQRLHARIRNGRRDELHKTTTTSKNHAIVCIENLKVRNMSKSAAGSIALMFGPSPSEQIHPRQGWFEFRRQLAYNGPADG